MYKKLSEKENTEINKAKVGSIQKILSKLQRTVDYVRKDNAFKIQENEKIIGIIERILEFSKLNQSGQGLKIVTLNQMLSRLPISLAQLNSEKPFQKNLKMKLGSCYILCTDHKNLQKVSVRVWLTLFKHGNNLYEQ